MAKSKNDKQQGSGRGGGGGIAFFLFMVGFLKREVDCETISFFEME